MRVVHSPAHLRHDPAYEVEHGLLVGHHELPVRAERVVAALAADDRFTIEPPSDWGRAPIDAVHDPGLVRFLETAWIDFQREVRPQREVFPDVFWHHGLRSGIDAPMRSPSVLGGLGRWCFEMATPLVEGSYGAARSAVDVALTAADAVLRGGERAAFGNCRPPGHHAARSVYGGFCYFNNAAIVAHHAATTTAARVTVLDVDYHHGNGTQQIFYDRADVQYVSLHGDPARAYPYLVGFADETGAGAGRGANLNVPLPAGVDDDAYLGALDRARVMRSTRSIPHSSSYRSASTRTAPIRSATSRSRRTASSAAAAPSPRSGAPRLSSWRAATTSTPSARTCVAGWSASTRRPEPIGDDRPPWRSEQDAQAPVRPQLLHGEDALAERDLEAGVTAPHQMQRAYDDLDARPWTTYPWPNVWNEPKDAAVRVKGRPDIARWLAEQLLDGGYDVAYAYEPLHHPGIADAFLNTQLFLDYDRVGFPWPIVCMPINCYGRRVISARGFVKPFGTEMVPDPPSPLPRRLMDVGGAVARSLKQSPWKVALVASSSWSHAFLTDKTWRLRPDAASDRAHYDALVAGDYARWERTTTAEIEDAGQQELLNWFALFGAARELGLGGPVEHTFVETHCFNSNKVFARWAIAR